MLCFLLIDPLAAKALQLKGNARIMINMSVGRRVFSDATQSSTSSCKKLGKHGSRKGVVRRARYLDPRTGRWLSPDPAFWEYMAGPNAGAGGIYNQINFNRYHYAGNNPIKYINPDGRILKVKGGIMYRMSVMNNLREIDSNAKMNHIVFIMQKVQKKLTGKILTMNWMVF